MIVFPSLAFHRLKIVRGTLPPSLSCNDRQFVAVLQSDPQQFLARLTMKAIVTALLMLVGL